MSTKHPLFRLISFLLVSAILLNTAQLPALALVQDTTQHTIGTQPTSAYFTSLPNTTTQQSPLPLTLARVQSTVDLSDVVDNTIVITFTVRNSLPPTNIPSVPPNATITDTLATLATFDYSQDPNVLHNIVLVDTFADGVTVRSMSDSADFSDQTYLWHIGNLNPLQTAAITVSLQLPASTAGFDPIDNGATAHATLQNRHVTAQAGAIFLVPDGFGEWLQPTVDADINDNYLRNQLATTGQSAEQIFAYAKQVAYESYSGSLRGTRGTLWSAAGNSTDQASLLIAMLRAAEIPARYRHGTLESADAQTLLANMFPPILQATGQIPTGEPTSDPINDPTLIAEAQDHWWVEAYLPAEGGWTDLDPSLAHNALGDKLVADAAIANDGTDRIAELPDSVRHHIAIKLKIEDYSPFNINGPTPGLDYRYPLSRTFPAVQLAGKSVALGHLLETTTQSGLIASNIERVYSPYLLIDGDYQPGDSYQEFISSYAGGLANTVYTGAWLEFVTTSPDGTSQQFERVLTDKLGAAVRFGGGIPSFSAGAESPPLIDPLDVYTTLFMPNSVPNNVLQEAQANLLQSAEQLNNDIVDIQQLDMISNLSPQEDAQYRAILTRYQLSIASLLGSVGLTFAAQADVSLANIENGLYTKLYYDTPRIITYGMDADLVDGKQQFNGDLRTTTARAIVYPGQLLAAAYDANLLKGVLESSIEGEVLSTVLQQPAFTTAAVFEAAVAQDVGFYNIDRSEIALVDNLPISADAKAYIIQALLEDKEIIVPQAPVSLHGEFIAGWWEIDPITGETIGMMENGLHSVFIEWLSDPGWIGGLFTSFMIGMGAYFMSFVAAALEQIDADGEFSYKAALTRADQIFAPISTNGTRLSCAFAVAGIGTTIDCATGLANSSPFDKGGQLAKDYISRHIVTDPPLPAGLVSPAPIFGTASTASTMLVVAPSLPARSVSGMAMSKAALIRTKTNSMSLYAPAVDGIGAGGDLSPFSTINFTVAATTTLTNATIALEKVGGTLNVAGAPLDDGLVTLFNYSGSLAMAEASGTTDEMALSGSADFFQLAVAPTTSTSNPASTVSFSADITTNYSDNFTTTVTAYDGWTTTISNDGTISATPAPGLAPGDYTLHVTIQSVTHPDLFASAIHTVTISSYDAVDLRIETDPLITVPFGDPLDTTADELNNGQPQITDAAYNLIIENSSNRTHQFALAVSGLPDGWAILSNSADNATLDMTIPAGETASFGLYVSPTSTSLPAAGTAIPFDVSVNASDGSGLNDSESATFVMPTIAYPLVDLVDQPVLVAPDTMASVPFTITNLGNVGATLPLTHHIVSAEVAPPLTISPANDTQSIAAGAAFHSALMVDTSGAPIGATYMVRTQSQAGAYQPSDTTLLEIAHATAVCVFNTAQLADDIDPLLAALLRDLSSSSNQFASDLSNFALRDDISSDLHAVADYITNTFPSTTVSMALTHLASELATHTDPAMLTADLANLCVIVTQLGDEIALLSTFAFSADLSPTITTTRPNSAATYRLALSNDSDNALTLRITTTTPAATNVQTVTLPATASDTITIDYTPATIGNEQISADIVAISGQSPIAVTLVQHNADLNIVTQFIEILNVNTTPAFVETGSSSTELAAFIASNHHAPRSTIAHVAIISPTGETVYSDTVDVTIIPNRVLKYMLGTVDTSGWSAGPYRIAVTVDDGMADGYVTVGTAIFADHATSSLIVPPGDITTTNTITVFPTRANSTHCATTDSSPFLPTNPISTGLRRNR